MRAASDMLHDLRMAFRVFRSQPSYAWSAVVVMALGVAAVTAVLSVLNTVLFTPLPYRQPERVALFRSDLDGFSRSPLLTSKEFAAIRERSDLFESAGAIVEANGSLTSPADMAPLNAAAVSDDFFATLGVSFLHGRSVTMHEMATRPVVISYGLWQRHFNGDPNVVGRRIEINDSAMHVTGVLPATFKLNLGPGVPIPANVDVFYPRGRGYEDDPFRGNIIIARLRPGVPAAAASAAVRAIGGNGVTISLDTIDREVASEIRPALLALAGAVAFVMLAACANLANLLVTRIAGRGRELAVRVSIGASRGKLLRQFLAEGLVVGAFGAAGGVLLAEWTVVLLLQFAPSDLPRRDEIALDATVAALAVAMCLVTAIVVSAWPIWQAVRADVAISVKRDSQTWQNTRATRGGLIAGQLALSLVLLAGFGLVARAFVNLRSVPLGFEPERAATMYISIAGQRFGTGTIEEARQRRLQFYRQLTVAGNAIAGVERFGLGFPAPMTGLSMVQPFMATPHGPQRTADGVVAFAGFLEALQVPLVDGRYFTTADEDRPVVIVDELLTQELWPDRSAIGQQIHVVNTFRGPEPREIVGVVRHVQQHGVRASGLPQLWMTYGTRAPAQLNAVLRASDPLAAAAQIDRAAQQLGSGRPIRDIERLSVLTAAATADTRFGVFVLGVFGVLAMLLTAIGVYGTVANAMVRRTREIAVRVALGADAQQVVRIAIGETAAWTLAGLVMGLGGAVMLTRYLSTLLFQIEPTDLPTFLVVAGALAGIAVAAAALPALRAARTDPMLAMRSD
ncbi:MAG TPA: ADOP family duplicated permease [Vicinamibacterales bacterium]|nr:ADOP family duplicated permease [Vicinamibacterales bacterium]